MVNVSGMRCREYIPPPLPPNCSRRMPSTKEGRTFSSPPPTPPPVLPPRDSSQETNKKDTTQHSMMTSIGFVLYKLDYRGVVPFKLALTWRDAGIDSTTVGLLCEMLYHDTPRVECIMRVVSCAWHIKKKHIYYIYAYI